jgi:hypothetical protein
MINDIFGIQQRYFFEFMIGPVFFILLEPIIIKDLEPL